MPTGYTADIYDGKKQTFPEFALKCARAFGALVEMRDDDMDAKIPKAFEPSDRSLKRVKELEKELQEVRKWSESQAARESQKDYNDKMKYYTESIKRKETVTARYMDMVKQVKMWNPPTQDHQGLKVFMLEQLKTGRQGDCYVPEKPKLVSGAVYRANLINGLQNDIAYYTKGYTDDVQRAKDRTEWVRALRESLNSLTFR